MNKIELIKQAITDAKEERSKLSPEVLDLQGFTAHKIKHLLNNLGVISSNYLEIGLHKASTFISTLYNNDLFGVGIDNWSQFQEGGVSKRKAYESVERLLPYTQYVIWDADCWTLVLPDDIIFDLFNYDGEHSFENQKRGITHFYPYLADEFILCVDDTSWKDPKEGTEAGIKEMNLEILFEEHLWDGKENGEWHNGFSVYLLKKTK